MYMQIRLSLHVLSPKIVFSTYVIELSTYMYVQVIFFLN